MTDQERAVMQQALEALQDVDGPITALLGGLLGSPDTDAPGAKVRAAIAALKAALAQEQAEPFTPDAIARTQTAWQMGYEARKAEEAEPVQKPVGWLEAPHGAFRANPLYKMQFPSQLLHWQIALYAAPPQRPPLTDEEIRGYADKHLRYQPQSYEASGVFAFARAIERKVRGEE